MRKEELKQHRQMLLSLRRRLTGEINSIVEDVVTDLHAPNEPLEAPSEAVDKSLVLQETEEGILSQVRDALERIDQGAFGTCSECGQDIPAGRLEAIPYTPWCVACARKMESLQRT